MNSSAAPDAASPSPLIAVKTPSWKNAPAPGYFINSVAVSFDGSRVVGGTFYHVYPKAEPRRASSPGKSGVIVVPTDNGIFGTYCYDGAGNLLWSQTYNGWQGIYWVGISADGSRAAAGGLGSQTAPQGIVQAFEGATGTILLNQTTQSRVNQVALSQDGTWLVSAAESLLLFRYDVNSSRYLQAAEFVPSNQGMPAGDTNGVVSVGISGDGTTIVLADYAGHIALFSNSGGTLTQLQSWQVPGGKGSDFCHMLDLASTGNFFAAGGSNGNFYLFNRATFIQTGQPTHTYATGVAGAVYGVAVEADGGGFAGVVNQGDSGMVYFVQCDANNVATLNCSFPTLRNPNCVALNTPKRLMAIADGHPDGTPGNFYLFENVSSGLLTPSPSPADLRWQCPSGNMSWPITISGDGSTVVAGSDDGNIYYFTAAPL
ncbi:WD40 repeat domain-containing protein [Oleiharenicola lentus]|uniref:WD40 repeat domain-containing protein n=1 Tax=Oleiharenicola lentus TaxID=2508720 RepID=UPI003F67BF71